jgi:hypothetical protein
MTGAHKIACLLNGSTIPVTSAMTTEPSSAFSTFFTAGFFTAHGCVAHQRDCPHREVFAAAKGHPQTIAMKKAIVAMLVCMAITACALPKQATHTLTPALTSTPVATGMSQAEVRQSLDQMWNALEKPMRPQVMTAPQE